jgi:hypothetical protein
MGANLVVGHASVADFEHVEIVPSAGLAAVDVGSYFVDYG